MPDPGRELELRARRAASLELVRTGRPPAPAVPGGRDPGAGAGTPPTAPPADRSSWGRGPRPAPEQPMAEYVDRLEAQLVAQAEQQANGSWARRAWRAVRGAPRPESWEERVPRD